MPLSWDERVVPRQVLDYVAHVQQSATCRIAGGVALSGVHLQHRLSRDVDLFCDARQTVRHVLEVATQRATEKHGSLKILRDGGTFVRAALDLGPHRVEMDIVHEPSAPLCPRDRVEGIVVESLADLRANKVTCLLSRSEPRDLVDLYFLDKAAFPPEDDLGSALEKDAGIDPGILSMLLRDFPVSPLPEMLKPLTEQDLEAFKADLAKRFRALALPGGDSSHSRRSS